MVASCCEADKTIVIGQGNDKVAIHPLGATIVSWIADGRERLFVSSKAVWDGSKPIRGGVPIVFPQFGTGPIMAGQHGFARRETWTLTKTRPNEAICTLRSNERTYAAWAHQFELRLTVRVESSNLSIQMAVVNLDEDGSTQQPFEFTALLHTYFAVDDIESVQLGGFNGHQYRDKLKGGQLAQETDASLRVTAEIDRAYLNVRNAVSFAGASTGPDSLVEICRENLPDIVLWNPWIEKSKAMADFDDAEYKKMICIEAGAIAEPIRLGYGQCWQGSQGITIKR